jgi:hypothetical protein
MTDESEPTDETETRSKSPEIDFNAEMESLVDGAAGLFESLRDIFLKSKQEVVRGAKLGKVRIDVFQLRKDREHFLQRLGEEALELLLSGEITHPDLEKPLAKLKDLDGKIAEHEAEMARIAEEVVGSADTPEAGETGDEDAVEATEDAPESAAEEPVAEAAEEEKPAKKPKKAKKAKKDKKDKKDKKSAAKKL